jgi:hypothetical protein
MKDKIQMGMSILDRINPDWHWRINLKTLALDCDEFCVLGQLYGSYDKARKKLKLSDDQSYELGFLPWLQKKHLNWLPFIGRRLTKAWRKAILNKRDADSFDYSMGKEPQKRRSNAR